MVIIKTNLFTLFVVHENIRKATHAKFTYTHNTVQLYSLCAKAIIFYFLFVFVFFLYIYTIPFFGSHDFSVRNQPFRAATHTQLAHCLGSMLFYHSIMYYTYTKKKKKKHRLSTMNSHQCKEKNLY